jgi:hypothetical protein
MDPTTSPEPTNVNTLPWDARGVKVYGRRGTDFEDVFGLTTGAVRECQLSGCRGVRVGVRWPDGKLTYPCSKGLTIDAATNSYRIG